MGYLDYNGLLYFWQKMKVLFDGKVNTVDGKGLSSQDYTLDEKTKLSKFGESSDYVTNTKLNTTISPLKASIDSFPDTYASKGYVTSAISSAGHLTRKKVTSLPAIADANDSTIYMILKANAGTDNLYDEYMLMDSKFEKIGDTGTEVAAITNAEISTIMESTT